MRNALYPIYLNVWFCKRLEDLSKKYFGKFAEAAVIPASFYFQNEREGGPISLQTDYNRTNHSNSK